MAVMMVEMMVVTMAAVKVETTVETKEVLLVCSTADYSAALMVDQSAV